VAGGVFLFQYIGTPDHLVDRPESQFRHNLAQLPGYKPHEVDHVLRLSGKFLAQFRVLGSHTAGAGIQVAHPHHHTAHNNQRGCSEAELFRAEEHRHGYIQPVISLPSVSTTILSRRLFSTRVWWVSATPSSQGSPRA
jgi:hypothetical protein